jgi:sortase (surface protein transpeptidase)
VPGRSRPWRPALAVVLAAAALGLVLGGCGALPSAPGPAPVPPPGAVDNREQPTSPSATLPPAGSFDAPAVPPPAPGFEVGELPEQVAAPGPASVPVRLVIPAIGVATPLVRLGLEPDGAMQVPMDFASAGWFAGGPAPGQLGPAVIAGHVDSRTGPAVFYRLRHLRPGHTIMVERADGTRLRFVVEQARSYPKAGFPTADVFGPVPSATLRLITCTGDFDRARGSYRDNLVVFARLAG